VTNTPDLHRQRDEFLADEGNQWFSRNRGALEADSPARQRIVQRLADQIDPTRRQRVLEIGCGPAQNLSTLAGHRTLDAAGIDPSSDAIAQGLARHPDYDLRVGTADQLPWTDAAFDVVWFGFCLYLVDRPLLQRVVAEADRVLADGGLLAILDFDPDQPCRRPYHHRPGLMSYKMDHARLFLANPAYVLIDKLATSHTTGHWEPDPQERVALTLCRKNLPNAYKA
jgi:ubiquinone/menaquinone biosynthesis C-methylase UbiE